MKLLERFGMTECKSMTTSMEMKFIELYGEVAEPDLENPAEYRKFIGARMFLVNTHLDICHSEHVDSIHDQEPPSSLDRFQTCIEIFAWDNHTWYEILC